MKSPERRIESLSKVIYSLSVKKNIYFEGDRVLITAFDENSPHHWA